MRVALYLRRSTDEILQADSLAIQEDILRAYADAHGHEVVDVYRDSASGRGVKGRADFQRLLTTVVNHPDFAGILVRDVSRWGRFQNLDESAYWEFFCLSHGVKVIYVEEVFPDDGAPLTAVLKTIKRAAAAELSRDKGRMIQRAQHHTVQRGFRLGGDPPFGMVRVLVNPAGEPVQVLKPGERKLISAHRIKLALGEPEQVAIVRRIYAAFAAGQPLRAIVKALNEEGIRSPRNVAWRHSTLQRILLNPAYTGTARGSFVASQNFKEPQLVLFENAWPAIVPRDLWDAVQREWALRKWKSTPDGLAHQARKLFERWGVVADARTLGESGQPAPDTYLKYFEGGDNEAIQIACESEIAAARAEVVRYLSLAFSVDDDGDTLLLDGVLRVGFKSAFPRQHRLGGVHWRFTFHGSEAQDVTIGMAFSPTKTVAVYFHLVNCLFRPKAKTIAPWMNSKTTRSAARSLEQLVPSFRRELLRYSHVARQKFLDAVKDLPLVNTYEVARSLGWSPEKGLSFYAKLRAEGVILPPLKKQASGRRVTLVCEDCGAERTMLVSSALQHKTSRCGPCTRLAQAKYRICPECGDRRRLGNGEIRKLSAGANTKCRSCTWKTRSRDRGRSASTGQLISLK